MFSESAQSRSSALPRTYVGRWLRAAMLDQRELRDSLTVTLNSGRPGWNDDEPAVAEAACELMLREFFGPAGPDTAAVQRLSVEVSHAYGADKLPISQQDAEAVICASASRANAVAGTVHRGHAVRISSTVAAVLAVRLGMGDAAVDALLREAERVAYDSGFHPALVPRGRSQ
jgi:hypothetical protein